MDNRQQKQRVGAKVTSLSTDRVRVFDDTLEIIIDKKNDKVRIIGATKAVDIKYVNMKWESQRVLHIITK